MNQVQTLTSRTKESSNLLSIDVQNYQVSMYWMYLKQQGRVITFESNQYANDRVTRKVEVDMNENR